MQRGLLVLRVTSALLVLQDLQVHKVRRVLQDQSGQLGQLDLQVLQDLLEQQVVQVLQDFREQQDQLVTQVRQVMRMSH